MAKKKCNLIDPTKCITHSKYTPEELDNFERHTGHKVWDPCEIDRKFLSPEEGGYCPNGIAFPKK